MTSNVSNDNRVYWWQFHASKVVRSLVAPLYHEHSKRHIRKPANVTKGALDNSLLDACSRRAFKEYALAPRIALPAPEPLPARRIDEIILERRSVRRLDDRTVHLSQLSALLG